MTFNERLVELTYNHEKLLERPNVAIEGNGVYERYKYPVLTAEHAPLFWRYDLNETTNPFLMERFGIHATLNSGAIKWNGSYVLVVRVEAADRKSFFAVAESPNGVDNFRFWDRPIMMPEWGEPATNVYDMRLTAHEDGWIYGIFCVERKDPAAAPGDLSSAVAAAGIARTKDLVNWERFPDLQSESQQRNVVLHPEFVDGKYALYTRPQDGFIDAGNGGGIGWALVDSMEHAVVKDETIINARHYHTIKEVKNGEGPHPIKTDRGWLHLAHGVRGCASGLRYVLYLYMTALDDPTRVIAEPAGCPVRQRLDRRRGWQGIHLLRFLRHSDARGHLHGGPPGRLLPAHGAGRPPYRSDGGNPQPSHRQELEIDSIGPSRRNGKDIAPGRFPGARSSFPTDS